MKKHVIFAPLFRQRHNKEIQLSNAVAIGTLPSRYHTLLLLLYLGSNLAYLVIIDWNRETYAVLADLRGRSGSLAALNIIATVLFALRNNPLSQLLGVSYDTFNLLHRWSARMMVVESTIHTVVWALNAMSAGGLEQVRLSLNTSTSYLWGMVGMCAFGAIFLLSFGPLRHAFYETFLNSHRILAALGLAGVYVHLAYAKLPQVPFLQLSFALWFAELAWRTFRIAYHNFSRKHGFTKVTIEALPAEACRVTFELSRPWPWKPGCHVHAYLPAIALWSSHPFSIAWAENRPREKELELDMNEKIEFPPPPTKSINKLKKSPTLDIRPNDRRPDPFTRPSNFSKGSGAIATITENTHKLASTNIALPRDAVVTTVSLVMRARTGMTRKLFEKAASSKTGVLHTWGAIEGPYGGHESMNSYGTVILFAGGVGITHCVGYLHHLILQYQAGIASTRKILLVWSVPNTEALEWVRVWMDKVLKMEGRRDVLRIQLFVTKPRHRGEVISNTGSVQMFPGRCNPHTIIRKEMQERIGAMGVTVCGPGAFSDSVRSAVREVVDVGSVDFVEEAFTY
jgi:predicted ferric reductase